MEDQANENDIFQENERYTAITNLEEKRCFTSNMSI